MRIVGQYELSDELGRGATARVYLGRHRTTGEQVCLKIFHESFVSGNRAMERIRRETKLAESLVHPNIVRVMEILEEDPPVLVMQYVQGQNLERLQPRLPYVLPEISVLIAIDIAKGLEFAHQRGIVHRDLKPENILVSNEGHVYVSDFGLAKIKDGVTVTETESVIGSLDYLAPEQASGDRVTPLSDLFSLGSILYFLTTGTRPFSKETMVATLGAIRTEEPESPQSRNPKLSSELSRIIMTAMQKKPEDRYPSVAEMRLALEAYLKGMGLSEEYFGLRSWFSDTTATTMEALHRSAEHLTQRCEMALKKRDQRAFIQDLSHLSAKAPASAALKRLTEAYDLAHSKSRMKKRLGAIAAVVLLVVATAGGVYFTKAKKTEAPKQLSISLMPSVPAEKTAAPTVPTPATPATAPKIADAKTVEKPKVKTKTVVKNEKAVKPTLKKIEPISPAPPPKTETLAAEADTETPDLNQTEEEPIPTLVPKGAETLVAPTPTGDGIVYFKVPKDAEIYWDHKRIETNVPLKNQRVGEHLLIINRPGYDLVRTKIMVKRGEPTRVRMHE